RSLTPLLSLHDALPISCKPGSAVGRGPFGSPGLRRDGLEQLRKIERPRLRGVFKTELDLGVIETGLPRSTGLRLRAVLRNTPGFQNGDDPVFQFQPHALELAGYGGLVLVHGDRKSTRLNSSHQIS